MCFTSLDGRKRERKCNGSRTHLHRVRGRPSTFLLNHHFALQFPLQNVSHGTSWPQKDNAYVQFILLIFFTALDGNVYSKMYLTVLDKKTRKGKGSRMHLRRERGRLSTSLRTRSHHLSGWVISLRSRFYKKYFAEMWSGSEEGSYSRLIDLYHSTIGSSVMKKKRELRAWGFGFRVWGVGYRDQGLGCGV